MKLRLLRFEGAGHRDARLAPLLLDFTGEERAGALDTVLWLRNGGGKSSILNLFYALLRPGRREFLGSETEGRQRRLEDYVAGEDTAHIVAEWEVPGQGALPGMGAATLVTGMVMEWRDRAKSADPTRLRRAWYAFYARPGSLSADNLPIHIDDGDETSGGRRAASLTRFCDLLRDTARADPALELTISEAQGEWQRRLTDLGLDPELFHYQLRMNRREGGAAELFRFRDADEFIDFLLELVIDPAEPGQVAANLAAYSDELAKRPLLELERDFVEGSLGQLRTLVEASSVRTTACARLAEAWKAADSHRQAFEAAARVARQLAADKAEEASQSRLHAREHERQRGRLQEQAAEMRRVVADLRLAAARALLAAAAEEETVATQRVAAWEAALVLAQRRVAAQQVASLDAELARAEQEAAPIRAERAAAASLVGRLEALRRAATARAAGFAAETASAEQEARAAVDRRVTAEGERKAAEQRLGEIARRRAEAESQRRALEGAGALSAGEAPADALTRLAQEDGSLAQAERDEEERLAAIDVARGHLTEERLQATGELARVSADRTALEARLELLTGHLEALRLTPRLVELAESEVVDVWTNGPPLVDRLTRLIERAEADLVALEIGGLEDRRALASLEETGLLPPPLDIEKVLGALEAARIPAVSGWRQLAESIPADRRVEAIARSPELASGVLVVPAVLQRARETLDAAGLVLSTAVVVGQAAGLEAQARPERGPADAPFAEDGPGTAPERFVVAPARALFDPGAAEAERAARAIDVERLDARRRQLQERREADAGLRDELRRFLHDSPEGTLERWQGELAQLASLADQLSRRITDSEQAEAALKAESADRNSRLKAGRQRRRAIANLVPRIQSCADGLAAVAALVPEERHLRDRQEWLQSEIAGAEAAEAEARDRRTAAERRRAEAGASADRLADERSRIEVEGPAGEDPPPELTLEALRERHRALDERYRGLMSNNVLADRRLRAAGEVAECDRRLGAAPLVDQIPAAEAILADATFAEAGARADGERQARRERDESIARRGQAGAGVTQAESGVRAAAAPDGHRSELPDELHTGDPEEAQAWAEMLAADALAASERATAAEKAAIAASDEQRRAEREDERMGSLAARLSAVLATYRQVVWGDEEPPAGGGGWPFERSYEEASQLTTGAVEGVEAAATAYREAAREVEAAANAVRRFALGDRFTDLRGKLRDRLVLDDPGTLINRASEHVDALDTRLAQLTDQLASLAEHQRLVVSALVGIVESALGQLRRAESSSRLPEALPGWAGRPFLQIRFDKPDKDEELFARLGGVIDRVVAEGSRPEGLPLLQKATRAAVGRRGFEVTILKPDPVLRPDRHPVTELNKFSDGEKLTATILLYCTLARLRARNRGRADVGGGMLILDNPIGTCSNVALLNLQRQVALAMGVQLIYTTGVNDLDALATLPNCIRLRNDQRDLRTGRLHVVADGADGSHNGLAATRVFRREPARTP